MHTQFDKLTSDFLIPSVVAKTDRQFSDIFKNMSKQNIEIDWYVLILHAGRFMPQIRALCLNIPAPQKSWSYQRMIKVYLDQVHFHHQVRNKHILDIVNELATEFEKEGIKVIFIKGAALLNTVYADDLGVRPVGDIDIIVNSADILRSEKLLCKLGFLEDYSSLLDQSRSGRDYFASNHFHYIYSRNSYKLELHWNLSFNIVEKTLDRLFRTSRKLENSAVLIPAVEMQVVITTLNFIHDALFSLEVNWQNNEWLIRRLVFSLLAYVVEVGKIIDFNKANFSCDALDSILLEIEDSVRISKLLCLASIIGEYELETIKVDPEYLDLCLRYAKTDPVQVIKSLY